MTTPISSLSHDELKQYPYKKLRYIEPTLDLTKNEDGSFLLRSKTNLNRLEQSIPHLFSRQAQRFPDRLWLSQKDSSGSWKGVSYAEFDQQTDSVAQWMLDNNLGQSTPLMILSENSIAHGVMIMAAMKAKVPVSSVSAPYSLMDKTLSKLEKVVDVLKPALIFAECGERYAHALADVDDGHRKIIVADNPLASMHQLADLMTTQVRNVTDSVAAIDMDTVAKAMFTSGSTGEPKCVIQTQEVLCAQVASIDSIFINDDPEAYAPISLQWMPWSHVSAGNISYHEAILKGGSIYIDDGKPIKGLFDKTLDNLRGLSTSVFGSAPLGLSWLVSALENDEKLQSIFFAELEAIAFGGSALPQDVADRIQRLSVANTGMRIPIISMYGSTETQGITATYWGTDIPGVIGLPMPGLDLKLTPESGKFGVSAKGPTVMKEYYEQGELTRSAFDDDGFFNLGDAAKFADDNPIEGLIFDGRISEDFKLLSGTWVSTVSVKSELLIGLGSLIKDLIICGENRLFICALAWIDLQAVHEYFNVNHLSLEELLRHPELTRELKERLDRYNQQSKGSSARVNKLVLLSSDPSMNDSEINEKGYINPKAVVAHRASLVESVYRSKSDEHVMTDIDFTEC